VIRTRHVTMGAVTFPPRRPEDAAGDADIMRRIRAGDRTAVDALYDRFRRPAFALARRILADDNLAEDVLQEVFLSVWRDPDGERVRSVVAEKGRYLGPRLRTDQLKRDGGRVPGGPSARHVRSTTVGSRSDVALHFLHIRHTRHAGGVWSPPDMPVADVREPSETAGAGVHERCV